jgi:hypothetical protein
MLKSRMENNTQIRILLLLFGDELFWTVKCGGQGWHKVNFYLGK